LSNGLSNVVMDFQFITEGADKMTVQILKTVSVVDMKLRIHTPNDAFLHH